MAIVATQVAAVQQLYVSYFGRPADPAGLDYWTNIVEAQKSTAAVSATFAASAEYKTAFEGKTNAQIVDQLYTNLFGRPADATGRAYWVDLLDKGTIKVDTIVYEVSLAALTTDKEAVENKVAAATAFTAALDTPAEVAGYTGDAALALAKAFITGVTTDATLATATAPAALTASVAAVVNAGTPFSLETSLASYLSAQNAKTVVLADLAENEDVAAALEAAGHDENPTNAQILDAIKAVQTAANTTANGTTGLGADFSTASAAMQNARISDRETALNTQLTANKTALTNANAEAAKVANLTAAIELYTANQEEAVEAGKAAALTATAQTAAVSNLGTLTAKPVVLNAGTSVTVDAKVVISYDATAETWKLATGTTETNTPGATALVAALNANAAAQEAKLDAEKARDDAMKAADILDSADAGVNLGAVKAAFVFTTLSATALPTWEQIETEQALFDDRLATLDAAAKLAPYSATGYADYLTDLEAGVAGSATAAALKTTLDAAVTAGFITAADRTAITTAANASGGYVAADAAAAVDANNWIARNDKLDQAVITLENAEALETGIGKLADAVVNAQDAIELTELAQSTLAEVVAEYRAAQALNTDVAASDKAIAAAAKVITDKGYAAPAELKTVGLNLATAKDDIFFKANGDTDAIIRSFGVQGKDTLYVGTDLTYNDTEIGAGTGQTALNKAGDNAVLEFFLQQDGNNVIVHIENRAYGSEAGGNADISTITLVGVDLEDITVANGFITV
ncbi:DUF4214 domain-containing protein [Massilia sp. CFBP9026]|uniref:DUF4214 domain-containing protein n=1 Tax=Massilia sp. CFBP9026 TaxID=3096536 RepID=UPI002A6B7582|nr:DUF4214 domain-containing protein [Massilia sp. CFBP9026]MDY0961317.1 DUF4214 domain-containing protein [Massilia sp. CFBP9026]